MKVVSRNETTLIYPLLEPEAEITYWEYIVVYPGDIRLKGFYDVALTPQEARKLAQALLHAVEIAEKGAG
jgi:hypothetical protein